MRAICVAAMNRTIFKDDLHNEASRTPNAFHKGDVSLTHGQIVSKSDRWETERLVDGLKLVVLGGGALACKLPFRPSAQISGPCICAIWNRGETEGMQSFGEGSCIPYTIITLSALAVEQHILGNDEKLRATLGINDIGRPHLSIAPVTRPVRALCAQIAACPLQGASRDLYLCGKAMEIAAHVLNAFCPFESQQASTLSTSDVEKIHRARDILDQRIQAPPTSSEIALAVGINERKLRAGFKTVFNETMNVYLQRVRLDAAFHMLAEMQMNVASAAYKVGYNPAYLSAAFRKKFGVSPKSIRGKAH
jgi:AraC family transcriptional activator of pyochelin receptor